ncbi:MAG: hypothetical protein PVH61_18965 [Candidatus Aminicenantes bacterium]|jgi:hypothetical protein
MKIKRWLILVLFISVSISLWGKKLAQLPDISRPYQLWVDNQQFYVTEGASVFIYSLQDFSLKKKFGTAGEGPQEFKIPPGTPGVLLYPLTDSLVINSLGKISFYKKEGSFIKELKNPAGSMVSLYCPLGSQFVGLGTISENQSSSYTFNIYDGNLAKIKEFHRLPMFQRGRMEFPGTPPIFYVSNNKIIVGGGRDELAIHIFDAKGSEVYSIKREYKRQKLTEDYKKGTFKFFSTNPATKQAFESMKHMITFPDYFPPIQYFFVDDQKIYIQTYKKKEVMDEFFIYDLKGKFLQRLFIPVEYLYGFMPYPIAIKNNTFYQLVENLDGAEEIWELHAHPIN